MNITRENTDSLNAVLKIEVATGDYLPAVEDAIRKYRKNVTLKGFRKGMVPASLVKKMYGNSIMYEELNKLVTDKINEHIKEENLEILGQPLPKEGSRINLDIAHPEDVTLEYELGLVPEFSLDSLGKNAKFNRHKVKIDESLIDEEVEGLRLRHGIMGYPEGATVEEKDVLYVDIVELENGQPKDGGHSNSGPIGLNIFKEEEKKKFLGMKPGEHRDVRLFDISERDRSSVRKFILGLKDEEAETVVGEEFRITLDKIGRMEKSELNEEFFQKIYGFGVVKTEEEFRDRLQNELRTYFDREAEVRLKNDMTKYILDNVSMDLPNGFLKRWIKARNEEPLTDEQVEGDYENFVNGLKWSLITNRIGSENDIKAEKEDIEALSRQQLRQQLEMYNPNGNPISEEDLDTFNASMMSRQDHVKKTYEAVMEQKLFKFIEEQVTITDKEVSLDEFRNLK